MQHVTIRVSLPSFYVRHSSRWLYALLLHFSNDRSNWSPSFSSTTFQNFRVISDLLSAVSKFQHPTKLHSKCSTLLVSSL